MDENKERLRLLCEIWEEGAKRFRTEAEAEKNNLILWSGPNAAATAYELVTRDARDLLDTWNEGEEDGRRNQGTGGGIREDGRELDRTLAKRNRETEW